MSNPDLPPDSITTLPPEARLYAIRRRYDAMAYSGPTPADRERDTVIGHLLDLIDQRTQQITDPEFPDLVGMVGGPMIPCKVVEFTATTAPTTRVEGVGDLDATYEHTQRYVIRYQPATWPREKPMPAFVWGNKGWWYRQALTEYWDAHGLAPKPHAAPDEVQRAVDWWNQRAGGEPAAPVHISYMAAAPSPQEAEAAKQAVLETARELLAEQQAPTVEVTTSEPDGALYFVCRNRHPLAVRTTTILENGERRGGHHEVVCPACEADGITEVRLPDPDDEGDDDGH